LRKRAGKKRGGAGTKKIRKKKGEKGSGKQPDNGNVNTYFALPLLKL